MQFQNHSHKEKARFRTSPQGNFLAKSQFSHKLDPLSASCGRRVALSSAWRGRRGPRTAATSASSPATPPGTPGLRPPCLVARPPRGAVHGRRSEPRPGARPSEGSREPGRARGPRTFRRLRSPGCGRRWASDLRPRALVGTVASKAKPRLN